MMSDRLLRGVLVGGVTAIMLIALWGGGAFRTLQLRSLSPYYVPRSPSDDIVIVALDDAAFRAYGRSTADWSREIHGDLVDRLNAAGARVVGFDLLFSQPARGDDSFVAALTAARSSENRLRIVVAAAGIQAPAAVPLDHSFSRAIQYSDSLLPIEPIFSAVDNIGFVNTQPDIDGTVRRQPSVIDIDGTPRLSFSLAMYLAYLRIPPAAIPQVVTQDDGILILPGDIRLPVDERGFWWQNYFGPPTTEHHLTFPVISLVDILNDDVDMAVFDDKVVLVGLINLRGAINQTADEYPVPSVTSGLEMSGVEIQAHAIESLIRNEVLVILPAGWQVGLISGLAVLASALYVYPHWPLKLAIAAVLLVSGAAVVFFQFNFSGVLVPLVYPALAISLPCLLIIGLDISREQRLRQRAEFVLTSLTHVSGQRLQIPAFVPLIAGDIQRTLPGSRGAVWVRDDHQGELVETHTWHLDNGASPAFEQLVKHAQDSRQTYISDNSQQAAIPVRWQKMVLAVIVVQHPQVARHLSLLEDIGQRLAPIFDSALLYKNVQRQRELLSSVLENSPSLIFMLGSNFVIQLANAAGQALIGETLPQPGKDVVQSLKIPEQQQADILQRFHAGNAFRYEVQIADTTYNIEAAPIESVSRWVVMLTDITALIELSNLKTRMLRMASHDLKNPLARILGYTELMGMDDELDESAREYLGHIASSADEMNQLIKDILDLERLRSGKVTRELFSFKELVLALVRRHEPDMTRKSQRLTKEISGGDLLMRGDMRQLSQAVSNLIGNAVKYTPEGGHIQVRLQLQPDDNSLLFEVEDDGIGIPEAAQEKLFTEFYRVKSDQTAHISGTGLGLSLVKSVAVAHGGRVGVESDTGQGSRFYLILPVDAYTESQEDKSS